MTEVIDSGFVSDTMDGVLQRLINQRNFLEGTISVRRDEGNYERLLLTADILSDLIGMVLTTMDTFPDPEQQLSSVIEQVIAMSAASREALKTYQKENPGIPATDTQGKKLRDCRYFLNDMVYELWEDTYKAVPDPVSSALNEEYEARWK